MLDVDANIEDTSHTESGAAYSLLNEIRGDSAKGRCCGDDHAPVLLPKLG